MIRQSYWSRSTVVHRFEPATGVLLGIIRSMRRRR
jgi:hypothetical protein